jgi:hypothetical protein
MPLRCCRVRRCQLPSSRTEVALGSVDVCNDALGQTVAASSSAEQEAQQTRGKFMFDLSFAKRPIKSAKVRASDTPRSAVICGVSSVVQTASPRGGTSRAKSVVAPSHAPVILPLQVQVAADQSLRASRTSVLLHKGWADLRDRGLIGHQIVGSLIKSLPEYTLQNPKRWVNVAVPVSTRIGRKRKRR